MRQKISKKPEPIILGTLKIGERFIFDSATWEVLQQNYTKERDPKDGKARCKKINTPVILNICRSNYVVRV
jgi:hypothetical protein